MLPWRDIEAMALHLAAISQTIEPGRQAALLLDQAGWHVSAKLLCAGQHHHRAPAVPVPGVEPARERLAVHDQPMHTICAAAMTSQIAEGADDRTAETAGISGTLRSDGFYSSVQTDRRRLIAVRTHRRDA